MACHSAVTIYDNLPSGQSAVSVRSANHKTPCRINKELRILVNHLRIEYWIKDIFTNVFVDLLLGDRRIMLCGKNNCFQTRWLSILAVLHCYLRLSVRAQVCQCTVFSYIGKLLGELMCQSNRIWHIFLSLIDRISEHHALISCSDRLDLFIGHLVLFCLQRLVNTHSDIGGLLVDCYQNAAGISVKSKFSSRVANLSYRVAHDLLYIDISVCCNLAHDHYKPCRRTGLTCHTAHRILLHQCVQNRVGNGIADFIRMTFRY